MIKRFNQITQCFILLILINPAIADVVVIVHPENPVNSLTREQIADLFLDKSKSFPDGKLSVPVNLVDEDSSRQIFVEKVLKRKTTQLRAYWADLIFTGKGKPPKTVDFPEDMLDLVSNNPSIIGYLDLEDINDSVKIVYRIKN